MGDVWAEAGGESGEAVYAVAARDVSTTTGPPGVRAQSGRVTPSDRSTDGGRQDRAEGDGGSVERDLRGRFPGPVVRLPARTQRAQRAGCGDGGDPGAEGELGARRRHSEVLRY